MYSAQEIAFIIKQTAKSKNLTIKQLLENCELSINTISELSKGKQISYISFSKIADCLDCSVDYLLGRSDNPNIGENNINNFDTTINGTQANIIQGAETDLDEIKTALSKLTSSNRHRAIADILDLLEKYIEK